MKRMTISLLMLFVFTSIYALKIKAGNAHTMHCTVNGTDWKSVGTPGAAGSYGSDTIRCPEITEDVFNNGAVLVYVLGTSGGGWYLLPHTYYSSGITVNFNYRPGYVELRSYSSEHKAAIMLEAFQYKVVVIPGDKK